MISQAVLHLELLHGARRGRQYVFRYLYGGWLVAQLLILFAVYRMEELQARWQGRGYSPGEAAWDYLHIFLDQQFLLVLLVTPAIAAGAITDEKERGTLQLLYSAGMTSAEIALGKWLGRMALVGNICIAGLPFLLAVGSFAGLRIGWLLLLIVQSVWTAGGVAAASVLASVWTRHTRDAVLAVYTLGGLAWLGLRLAQDVASANPGLWYGGLLHLFDPIYVWEPIWTESSAGDLFRRLIVYIALWGLLGGGCLILALWRLRPAYLRQLQRSSRGLGRRLWGKRAPVSDDPVRWKEVQIEGLAPLPALRFVPRWLALTLIGLASLGWSAFQWFASYTAGTPGRLLTDFLILAVVGILAGSLIVGIRCSGAITAEREKQTWEALLLTPLSTEELIRSKLWGIINATYPYLLAFAVPPTVLALISNPTILAVWLAAMGVLWLGMYYSASAGLWCSARSHSSWRSLLGLLGWVYAGGFVVYGVVGTFVVPVIFLFVFLVAGFLLSILTNGAFRPGLGWALGYELWLVAVALFLVFGFWYGARRFIRGAEKRVADYDRARHWGAHPDIEHTWRRLSRQHNRPIPVPRHGPGGKKESR